MEIFCVFPWCYKCYRSKIARKLLADYGVVGGVSVAVEVVVGGTVVSVGGVVCVVVEFVGGVTTTSLVEVDVVVSVVVVVVVETSVVDVVVEEASFGAVVVAFTVVSVEVAVDVAAVVESVAPEVWLVVSVAAGGLVCVGGFERSVLEAGNAKLIVSHAPGYDFGKPSSITKQYGAPLVRS